MMDYSNLDKVQEIIEKEMPYRVYLREGRPKDLAEIIHRMMVKQEITYGKTAAGDEITQCSSGRMRSIEDVYLCMRSYKKTTAYSRVYNAVERLYAAPMLVSNSNCPDVQRRVHLATNLKITVEQVRDRIGDLNLKINAKPRTTQAQAGPVHQSKSKGKVQKGTGRNKGN